jgi:amino acid adenylation domain-containing protein
MDAPTDPATGAPTDPATGATDPALYARFLRGLARSPDRAAIRVGGERVSYTAVHQAALTRAGALLACSTVDPPTAIGVLADKSVESYVGLLAALYTGATAVPLNPDFPPARTRRMLELAGVSAVLADEHGLAIMDGLHQAGVDIPVLAPHHTPATPATGRAPRLIRLDPANALAEPCPVKATDTAYMLFTSGSTGNPKGVPITHGSTQHYFDLLDRRYDFGQDDVFSQTFDLNFDCAIFDLFCAWGAGASVHAMPPTAYRDLPAYCAESGLTVWFSTPSAIGLQRRLGGLPPGALRGLRWSLFAGEALHTDDAALWQAAAPDSVVENLYGPTELTVTITAHRWSPDTSPGLAINGLAPIGALHEGHDHVLLTEDGGYGGTEGELCITGPQMTAGYLDPADNEGRFLHHDGRTWYRTGDRVRRHRDGEFVYLGRLDSQVQVQGWRVELAEIDHAVRACPGVQDAVTVTRRVNGVTEFVVYYTGEPTSPVEFNRQLREILPHGMLPRQYRHVDEFPLNSNRKVDRSRLAAEAATATGVITRAVLDRPELNGKANPVVRGMSQ